MKRTIKPTRIKAALALVGLTLASAVSSQAALWTAGTDTWNNAANWGGTIPVGSADAVVNNGGTVLIASGDPTWTPRDFRAGDGSGSGTYNMTGGTVTLNGWFRMAINAGTGTFNFSGGTVNSFRFIVADGNGAVATVNQSGGLVNIINDELWVGQGGGSSGTYNLSGTGQININSWVAIGRGSGTGVFNMTNGFFAKYGGGGSSFIVGANGNGTLNQYGGTVSNTVSESWIGEGSGTGVWDMQGGTAILGTLNIAQGGTATLNLGSGATLVAKEIKKNGGSGTFNFNGGTLQAGATTTTLMHDIDNAVVNSDVRLDTAGFNVTVAQVLGAGASGGVIKSGAGTAKLTGASTYTGANIVQAGKLLLGTATAVTSPIIVSNGAGAGVIVAALNAQVSPSNVTLGTSAATTLDFDLGNFGNPTSAPLNVTANLAVNGTVSVNVADAFPQVGQFPLVKYVTKSGSGSFVVGTLPVGVSATVSNNIANSSIDLVISSTSLIRWNGNISGAWDINTTTNWTDYVTLAPSAFNTGAAVFFDDIATGTTNVTLGVAVSPGSVVFTNDALAYTISGNGSISGATSLTKQGTNTVTISTTNNYTGATIVSGGTLSINNLGNGGAASSIGSSSSSSSSLQLSGGALSYTGPATSTDRGYSLTATSTLDLQSDLSLSGIVTPSLSAGFLKTGPGTLTYTRQAINSLATGNYLIGGGTVLMDGTASGQTNGVTGELWPGGGVTGAGGNLVVSNATLNVSSWLAIARGTGTGGYTSSATFNNAKVTSGNMSLAYDNGIGGTVQTGLMTLNGNTTYTNGGDANMGESAGGTTVVTLNDSSVFYSGGRLQVGWHNGANASLVAANSAKVVVNAWMSIGNEAGVGSVLLKDSSRLYVQSDLNVCDVNTGTADLTLTNSANATANNLFVGKGAGSVGVMTVNTGTTFGGNNGGGSYVEIGSAAGASGTININGGTFSARRIRSVNGGSGTLNLNGGLLRAARDGADAVNADFLNNITAANVLAGGANIDTGTNNIAIGQALADGGGGGGLNKTGTGQLLLNAVNAYTGNTVATGTLGGSGSVVGNVSAASLSPGDASGVGQFTIGGNLTFNGNLNVDVATSVSPSNDVIAVTGTLNYTGAGSVNVANLGPVLTVGQKFYLFNQPLVGGAALAVTGGGATWTNKLAIDGSIQVLTVLPAPVFTPASVATLPDGNKSVTATGVVGQAYRLWATTDVSQPVSTWTLLNTGTVTVSPFTINDLNATNFPARYYTISTP